MKHKAELFKFKLRQLKKDTNELFITKTKKQMTHQGQSSDLSYFSQDQISPQFTSK